MDKRFYQVVENYLMKYLELNPIYATYLGIHKFDSQMPRGDKQGIIERKELLVEFKNSLEDIKLDKLSLEARIDYKVSMDTINLHLFYIDEWPLWKMYPFAGGDIGESLFPLFIREFAPFIERFSSIVARMEKGPKYLRESMECLEDPVETYIDTVLEGVKQLPIFIEIIYKTGVELIGRDDHLVERAKHAVEKLRISISEYSNWLFDMKTKAKKDFAMGKERFKKLLELRGIELPIDKILRLGEGYLDKFKNQLKQLADQILPGASPDNVRRMLEDEHPRDFAGVIREYERAMERAKKFIVERKIAPIPDRENIKVMETPHYLHPIIPFAAYFPPAPFDKEKLGIYIITPPTKGEHFKRHNYYSISNTSVHEAYPGHHLQLSWTATVKNLVRIISFKTEFVEGWAHYCEDLMKEYGFDNTPKHKFIQLIDSIWRAVRIIIDVKLSTGMMTFDEAVDLLSRETGMDREAAIAEVRRYTFTPGYQLSYLLGKHLLRELRREVKNIMKDKYNDYIFHELILKSGGLPYKYLKEYVIESVKMKL